MSLTPEELEQIRARLGAQGPDSLGDLGRHYRTDIPSLLAHVAALQAELDAEREKSKGLAETLRAIRMTYGFGSSPHQSVQQQMELEKMIDEALARYKEQPQ